MYGMSRDEAFAIMCGAARRGDDPARAIMAAALARPPMAPQGHPPVQDRPNALSASTQSYLDHRRRTRTTVTKMGEAARKTVKKISKPEGPCCKSSCRKAIPAGKTGKAGWQAQYNFATYGEGSTRKNVTLWFHTECCPVNDPLNDELALEFFLGDKCPQVTCDDPTEAEDPPKKKAKKLGGDGGGSVIVIDDDIIVIDDD